MLRNPVKRKLSSSALFNLLHVHFHGNIFSLTNSNEYLIRKQLRTFTSMQSYFQLKKKNIPQHFETFDTLDLYMSGFLYSNKKKHCHPSELWIFSNNHTQLYNFFKYKAYSNKTERKENLIKNSFPNLL